MSCLADGAISYTWGWECRLHHFYIVWKLLWGDEASSSGLHLQYDTGRAEGQPDHFLA